MTVTEKIRRVLVQGELTKNADIAEVCGCSARQVTRVRSAMRGLDTNAVWRATNDRNIARLQQDISDLRRAFLRDKRSRREQGHRYDGPRLIRAHS